MQVSIKNLGPLKEGNFELGKLTIICGKNNTGKTYVAHALFGFLHTTKTLFEHSADSFSIQNRYTLSLGNKIITKKELDKFLEDGEIELNLVKIAQNIVKKRCEEFTSQLPHIFAAPREHFHASEFTIDFQENELKEKLKDIEIQLQDDRRFISSSILKEKNSEIITIKSYSETNAERQAYNIHRYLLGRLGKIILDNLFQSAFISSAERTGIAVFNKDLNLPRNRLIDEIDEIADEKRNRIQSSLRPIASSRRFFRYNDDYPLPLKFNMEFTRNLSSLGKLKKPSDISAFKITEDNRKIILMALKNIFAGEYRIVDDEIVYISSNDEIELTMNESSSSVRSLVDIAFYLKYEAMRGDLLIIDEPELNLHPENQRLIARLLATLVGSGINVFIATYSDYIIKELNTLIMLNQKGKRFEELAKSMGYQNHELLDPKNVRVYSTEKEGDHQILSMANIDEKYGIEMKSFDIPIDEMNRIQGEILWGRDLAEYRDEE